MMEVILAHGADVNAFWHGHFPESSSRPVSRSIPRHWAGCWPTAPTRTARVTATPSAGMRIRGRLLDYVIASYGRVRSGWRASTSSWPTAQRRNTTQRVLAVLRRQADRLEALLDVNPQLARMRFPQLDCGQTGGRSLTLAGATLLHLAARVQANARPPASFSTGEPTSMAVPRSTLSVRRADRALSRGRPVR